MARVLINESNLENIADAIRAKNGSSDTYLPSQMATAISNISTVGVEPLSVTDNGTYTAPTGTAYSPVTVNVSGGGGGGTVAEQKQINFIDYDGTIVDSYTAAEWASVTALPDNPSHTGLTSQGWNWTKAQIDSQLSELPDGDICVGQMYITTSGDTEIDVVMQEGRLSPIMTICVDGTITIDWGDGTAADTVTGTSLTSRKAVPHTYASGGSYMITIHIVSGTFQFYGSSGYELLRKDTTVNANRVYANCIQSIRLGSNVTKIGDYAFSYCHSLASITIPSGVTSIGGNVFFHCYSLASITIPSGVTSIGNNVFYNCYSLASIAIPSGVTSIEGYVFDNCYSLASITIPNGVTGSIGNYVFGNCYSLASITIPNGVTGSIGDNVFYSCYSLANITIPNGVTSIGSSVFYNCFGIAEYHIKPTTPPALANTNAFRNIQSDCVIYVPSESLEAYKTASNWSNFASHMQGE